MITNKNFKIFTKSLINNKTSKKRVINLLKEMKKYNIKVNISLGYKEKLPNNLISIKKTFHLLLQFKKSNKEYGLICDDDFSPCNDFLNELNRTVELLPKSWEELHLCPGFMWSCRGFNNKKPTPLKFNPRKNINDMKYDKSGRFFTNINSDILLKYNINLGPIALLLHKKNIDKFIIRFMNRWKFNLKNNLSAHDDTIFMYISNKNTFICRNPQLGYEKQQGGSTTN